MRKTCADCGEPFEAKRTAARFCSPTCRQRAHRRPEQPAEILTLQTAASPGSLAAATQARLEAADRLDSPDGQAALVLARRIDAGGAETGSALASMVREHRAALTEAVRDARVEADPMDELKGRRERKLAGH